MYGDNVFYTILAAQGLGLSVCECVRVWVETSVNLELDRYSKYVGFWGVFGNNLIVGFSVLKRRLNLNLLVYQT